MLLYSGFAVSIDYSLSINPHEYLKQKEEEGNGGGRATGDELIGWHH